MKKRRVIAAMTAVLLGVSTVSTGVLAADSYREAEKAAFQKAVESLAESYGKSLENYESAMSACGVDITASLDDAGRAILGMFAPADVSWLQDAKIATDVSISDNNMSQNMDFFVNGTKICSMEYYMNLETLDVYMKIPELADGYIKVNIAENMDAAEQGTLKSLNGLEEMLPEIEPVKELLDRYGTILLDGINDEESTAETLSAGGVDQECTALEGSISAKEAVSLIQEILNTAKEDEELKNLIESWTKDMDD